MTVSYKYPFSNNRTWHLNTHHKKVWELIQRLVRTIPKWGAVRSYVATGGYTEPPWPIQRPTKQVIEFDLPTHVSEMFALLRVTDYVVANKVVSPDYLAGWQDLNVLLESGLGWRTWVWPNRQGYAGFDTARPAAKPISTTQDETAIRQSLIDNPGDIAGWSAYADWLMDHTDPRGELISAWLAPDREIVVGKHLPMYLGGRLVVRQNGDRRSVTKLRKEIRATIP